MRRGVVRVAAVLAMFPLLFLLAVGSSAPPAVAQEQPEAEPPVPEPPEPSAAAWALADADSGLYLAGENADEPLPIASMTKVMVALMALEGETNLEEEVEISEQAEEFVGGVYSNVGLIQGEQVTVRDLLVATLVPSGTEAAYALAEHLGGGSVEQFVASMNERADELGLENTSFADPAGLDDPENYSSARDLSIMTSEALQYPLFVEIVGATEVTIATDNREIEAFTTNELLYSYPAATGVKTGTSPEAGPSLVGAAEAEDERYLAVVLDAAGDVERFTFAEELLRYGFDNYEREALVQEGEVYEESALPFRRGESVALVAAEEIAVPVAGEPEVERRVDTGGELPASAGAGDVIGEVEALVGGESVGSAPLVAREGYEEASILNRAWFWVSGFFQ